MAQPVVSEKVLYPELSFDIMGAVYEVHNHLGPGFSEELYERALIMELNARHISYEQQKTIQVSYKGQPLGIYRLDLVVADQIILELKAASTLNDTFRQQLRSYLKASGLRLGILINFGASTVQSERIVN
jgi:GxxExxY protein